MESSQNPMTMLNYMLDGYLVEYYTSVPTYKVCESSSFFEVFFIVFFNNFYHYEYRMN
jgi:hypothetical protein